jgi:hypothetical protein
VTLIDYSTGVKWKRDNLARRSGRGDYVELNTELNDWVEHDHVHEHPGDPHGEDVHDHGPLGAHDHSHDHSCSHSHAANGANGAAKPEASAVSPKDNPPKPAKEPRKKKDDYREKVSFDTDSESEDSSDAESVVSVDPRAPLQTKFRYETQDIKVGEDCIAHLKKYFPTLQPSEDILVVVGSVALQLDY